MVKRGWVSVIIVTHNGKKHVSECIDSVIRSTFEKIEAVVVDNGSSDGSCQFLKNKYRRGNVRIFRINENRFFTGGNNFGATKAIGEKLIFLNDDTVVDTSFVENLVKCAGKNKKCLVQPKVLRFYNRKTIDNAGGFYTWWGMGVGRGYGQVDRGQFENPSPLSYVVGTVFMIDASFFWKIGGFDEWFKYHYEDVDLSLRARKNGGECWYCPGAVVYHKGSLTVKKLKTSDLKLNIRKNRLMVILKNFKGIEKLFRLALCLTHSFGGVRPVFDKYVQDFVDERRWQEISEGIDTENKNLLDVGCGDGNFVLMARKNGFEAWGIDKEPRISNKYISPAAIESFKTGKKYDLITVFHVLEHLKNPLASLSKLSGNLKNGGCLVFEVPLIGNLTEKFLKKEYFAYFDKTHVNLWKKQRWLQLIRKAGLTPVRQGLTGYEFPFAVISGGFRKGILWGVVGLVIFLPLKLLMLLGLNEEIVRIYCIKTPKR